MAQNIPVAGQPAVILDGLTKDYAIYHGQKSQMKRLLFSSHSQETYRALDHITATFNYGERVGLIGLNGSGKSTLSSIISGITQATDGKLQVNGTVSMLNTNVGLKNTLTGRESIYYKCLLLGFTNEQIREMEQRIIDFADIGIFIDQPMRTYSSGMRARLGFAISAQLEPDILVVDEALAVGDDSFASKCEDWMKNFSESGRCIVFVSHSLNTMRQFCEKILWLHKGHQVAYGDAAPLLDAYSRFSREYRKLSDEERRTMIPDINKLMAEK